ncbi:fumarylacetoacetate hydrolase family protein [Frankia sp. AgB1.9]|uniref:fumarylacetoacetate hydrolase family protein n=1 Tax=unclassified Frankia TaxID=2632575 RepID=UPI001932B871|nr:MULTISPECIES: fumarylacetoacetate hydrolase family protein [unclassified Frankia]MBL7493520.1 fumarylacetoacetate hydrolase family protein [Frankia sp. AgW1.1]MBL7552739.1 fumarylacetoacetate hydrolase family protein [Frankia sp. AgB1.9]MBL7624646.1 fumarylacetoacetate hydrolase family protein [Frankia sp. AgB1.8]
MRLAKFVVGAHRLTGIVLDDVVVDVARLAAQDRPVGVEVPLGPLLAAPADRLEELAASARARAGHGGDGVYPLAGVELVAPVEPGNKILCQVVNYAPHGQEANIPPPAKPFYFYKPYSSLAGPATPLLETPVSGKLDYECELAVVIGRPGKNIAAADAFDHIAAYTVMNDVSYRDLQFNEDAPSLNQSFGRNWTKGKGLDRGCVLGPWLTTADEVGDPYALRLTTHLNGDVVQAAKTGEMLLRIPELIAEASLGATLEAGDIIATGTPSGVGLGTGRYLRAGDEVVCAIDGLGELRNRVVTASL